MDFKPWLAMCERQYRREILRHAQTVQDQRSLDWWVMLSRDWIEHYVTYSTKAMGLSDADKTALADSCVTAFNESYKLVLETMSIPTYHIA